MEVVRGWLCKEDRLDGMDCMAEMLEMDIREGERDDTCRVRVSICRV